MAFTFSKATKAKSKLRLALIGLAGSGKTYSALSIASNLSPGGRVAVIDTERGSASLYADRFGFDVLELDRHGPDDYVDAIEAAVGAGYDVVVIDSLSHAWAGRDGALEQVDKIAKREGKSNNFTAWRDVTPKHNRLVDAMLSCRAHLIATLRSKMEYVLEPDERGKMVPRKIGLAPIQREGLDYEFTIVGDLNLQHQLIVSKSRAPSVAAPGDVIDKPGERFAIALRAWLDDGAATTASTPQAAPPPPPNPHRTGGAAEVTGVPPREEEPRNSASVAAPPPPEASVLSELDKAFSEYLANIAEAPTIAALDKAATGPAKPEKGTRAHELATKAYRDRKSQLQAQTKAAS